ncbi:hypothetical protein G6O67_006185 [Ophiocordyceps sinensis]|uniref:Uncharacterized protein n=1 Tax=Ophiocordyceps sinensis TaxID=72228 RepID=A0A8H4PLU2_9HYPO|nr:hypothetical protein G6O67_006185 [Ophiocordyceps sinensis]
MTNAQKAHEKDANNTIVHQRQVALVGLGLQVAQEVRRRQGVMLTMMLCRADLHNTTKVNGKYVPDLMGYHATMACKTTELEASDAHVVCHGYTKGRDEWALAAATFAGAQDDNFRLPSSGKVAWPWPRLEFFACRYL